MRTHYDNLHISEKASPEVIRAAYKALAQKWHPDRNVEQRDKAERYFKIISDAFEKLSNPKLRAEYDAWLTAQRASESIESKPRTAQEPPVYSQAQHQKNRAAAREDGRNSRKQGLTAKDSPYSGDLLQAWLLGFNEVKEQSQPTRSPPKEYPDPSNSLLATRWPRFFARTFDVWWETMLIALILGVVLGFYSAGFVEWINKPGASQLFGILCLPIALVLDALLYRAVGNTPGKALLRLKVGAVGGSSLSLVQYLRRNFSLWWSGFALGVPFINLITMANQSGRLGKGRQASYDESTGFRVYSKSLGWGRKAVFCFSFVGLFVGIQVLNVIGNAAQHEPLLSATKENYSWENPITQLAAKIDSRWKYSAQLNSEGQQIYTFTDRSDYAVVILGVEQASSYTLDDYVRAFQKGVGTSMRFSDAGRFFEGDGRQTWQGTGSLINSTGNRLNVQVVQVGSAFWRVVTIQTIPYDYSDALVAKLHAVLWATIK